MFSNLFHLIYHLNFFLLYSLNIVFSNYQNLKILEDNHQNYNFTNIVINQVFNKMYSKIIHKQDLIIINFNYYLFNLHQGYLLRKVPIFLYFLEKYQKQGFHFFIQQYLYFYRHNNENLKLFNISVNNRYIYFSEYFFYVLNHILFGLKIIKKQYLVQQKYYPFQILSKIKIFNQLKIKIFTKEFIRIKNLIFQINNIKKKINDKSQKINNLLQKYSYINQFYLLLKQQYNKFVYMNFFIVYKIINLQKIIQNNYIVQIKLNTLIKYLTNQFYCKITNLILFIINKNCNFIQKFNKLLYNSFNYFQINLFQLLLFLQQNKIKINLFFYQNKEKILSKKMQTLNKSPISNKLSKSSSGIKSEYQATENLVLSNINSLIFNIKKLLDILSQSEISIKEINDIDSKIFGCKHFLKKLETLEVQNSQQQNIQTLAKNSLQTIQYITLQIKTYKEIENSGQTKSQDNINKQKDIINKIQGDYQNDVSQIYKLFDKIKNQYSKTKEYNTNQSQEFKNLNNSGSINLDKKLTQTMDANFKPDYQKSELKGLLTETPEKSQQLFEEKKQSAKKSSPTKIRFQQKNNQDLNTKLSESSQKFQQESQNLKSSYVSLNNRNQLRSSAQVTVSNSKDNQENNSTYNYDNNRELAKTISFTGNSYQNTNNNLKGNNYASPRASFQSSYVFQNSQENQKVVNNQQQQNQDSQGKTEEQKLSFQDYVNSKSDSLGQSIKYQSIQYSNSKIVSKQEEQIKEVPQAKITFNDYQQKKTTDNSPNSTFKDNLTQSANINVDKINYNNIDEITSKSLVTNDSQSKLQASNPYKTGYSQNLESSLNQKNIPSIQEIKMKVKQQANSKKINIDKQENGSYTFSKNTKSKNEKSQEKSSDIINEKSVFQREIRQETNSRYEKEEEIVIQQNQLKQSVEDILQEYKDKLRNSQDLTSLQSKQQNLIDLKEQQLQEQKLLEQKEEEKIKQQQQLQKQQEELKLLQQQEVEQQEKIKQQQQLQQQLQKQEQMRQQQELQRQQEQIKQKQLQDQQEKEKKILQQKKEEEELQKKQEQDKKEELFQKSLQQKIEDEYQKSKQQKQQQEQEFQKEEEEQQLIVQGNNNNLNELSSDKQQLMEELGIIQDNQEESDERVKEVFLQSIQVLNKIKESQQKQQNSDDILQEKAQQVQDEKQQIVVNQIKEEIKEEEQEEKVKRHVNKQITTKKPKVEKKNKKQKLGKKSIFSLVAITSAIVYSWKQDLIPGDKKQIVYDLVDNIKSTFRK